MNFKALLKNTNTTVVAIIALAVALIQYVAPEIIPPEVMTILIGSIGVLAKDGDKTSKGLGLE